MELTAKCPGSWKIQSAISSAFQKKSGCQSAYDCFMSVNNLFTFYVSAEVSITSYIILRPKSCLNLLQSPELPLRQWLPNHGPGQTLSCQIPEDGPQQGIDGYGGKTLRKGRFQGENGHDTWISVKQYFRTSVKLHFATVRQRFWDANFASTVNRRPQVFRAHRSPQAH